ncbi:hypothetical protein [Lamprocystis purpurea]|jgi:hypothetical protein|uniref:hypothetical protein n=1 Tax=Lamprocystis purpurea TaxID=61598 RepID=UPI00146C2D83|nr:hypothetical protein [Lamprocystis purpurea]
MLVNLTYDPGEHRVKHCWNKPEAGFVALDRGRKTIHVGKCPNTLSKAQAEQLLQAGVSYPLDSPEPERIYNVHEGIVYEAVNTGDSPWHGYPWRARPGNAPLPDQIKQELERRAVAAGYGRAFKNWMKNYGR